MRQKGADRMTNSVEPDLSLHCLLKPVCPNTVSGMDLNTFRPGANRAPNF